MYVDQNNYIEGQSFLEIILRQEHLCVFLL